MNEKTKLREFKKVLENAANDVGFILDDETNFIGTSLTWDAESKLDGISKTLIFYIENGHIGNE